MLGTKLLKRAASNVLTNALIWCIFLTYVQLLNIASVWLYSYLARVNAAGQLSCRETFGIWFWWFKNVPYDEITGREAPPPPGITNRAFRMKYVIVFRRSASHEKVNKRLHIHLKHQLAYQYFMRYLAEYPGSITTFPLTCSP